MSTSDNIIPVNNNMMNYTNKSPIINTPSSDSASPSPLLHNIYQHQSTTATTTTTLMHPLAVTSSIASYSSPDLTRFRRRSLPSMQKLREQALLLPSSPNQSISPTEDLSNDAQETNAAAGALWGSVHFFKGLQSPSPKLISPWSIPPHASQLQQSMQHVSETALDVAREAWTFRPEQWKKQGGGGVMNDEDSPGSQKHKTTRSSTSNNNKEKDLKLLNSSASTEGDSDVDGLDEDHSGTSLRRGSPVGLNSSGGSVVDVGRIDPDADPVIQLSQLCQRHRWVYQFSAVTPGVGGGVGIGGFQCKCIVGSLIFPDGWGSTQEEAVRVAAQQALNAISYVRGPEQEQGQGSPNIGGIPTTQASSGSGVTRLNGSGSEEEIRERVRKSAYCRHFKARGWCSFGNNCRFIHGALIGLDDFSPAVPGGVTALPVTQPISSSSVQQQQQQKQQPSTNAATTSLSSSGPLSASKTTGATPSKTSANAPQTASTTPSLASPVSSSVGPQSMGVTAGIEQHRDNVQPHYVRFEDEMEKFGGASVGQGDMPSSTDVMEMLGWLGGRYQDLEIDNQRLRSENRRLSEEVNGLRSQLAKSRMYG